MNSHPGYFYRKNRSKSIRFFRNGGSTVHTVYTRKATSIKYCCGLPSYRMSMQVKRNQGTLVQGSFLHMQQLIPPWIARLKKIEKIVGEVDHHEPFLGKFFTIFETPLSTFDICFHPVFYFFASFCLIMKLWPNWLDDYL